MSFFQSKIPIFKPRRSTQNLSRSNHLTSKMGKITPFMCEKNESGDRFSLGVLALGRTMPLFTPVMDQLTTKFAFYHITIRSIWDGFEDFITSASNYSLNGQLPPEIPQATMKQLIDAMLPLSDHPQGFDWKGSQLDYFDYPWFQRDSSYQGGFNFSSTAEELPVSLLPLIAHAYIYHEDFVNENIQDVLDLREIRQLRGNISTWSDAQKLAFFRWVNWCQLFDVNWRKDYLTAAQPYTQKGMSVQLPLNITIPDDFRLFLQNRLGDNTKVLGIDADGRVVSGFPVLNAQDPQWTDTSGNPVDADDVIIAGQISPSGTAFVSGRGVIGKPADFIGVPVGPSSMAQVSFYLRDSHGQPVELQSGLTIEDLRTSSAIQRLLESMSVHGTRYNEYILGQYGVKISDHTLGLPHFIAGNSMPIQIGEVVQTSATETDSALGRFAGSGYQKGGAAGARYYAEEHGYIIGIMWTKPPTHYMWGVPRHLAELDPFEWMNPHFANLGQQEVFDYEAMREPEDPVNIFGYLQRYDHLRTSLDRVHGDMRDSLADWHLARNNVSVALNSDFIKAQPDTRIFNVTDTSSDHLVHHLAIRCVVKRNIPRHANPKLL